MVFLMQRVEIYEGAKLFYQHLEEILNLSCLTSTALRAVLWLSKAVQNGSKNHFFAQRITVAVTKT
jgi:hypothetical protein